MRKLLLTAALLSVCSTSLAFQQSTQSSQNVAVKENNYSITFDGNWQDHVDVYTLQADGTFSLGQYFGASVGANGLYIDADRGSDDIQNIRAAAFARSPEVGRLELSYQNIFFPDEDEDFWGLTGEYYFDNWTLGAYFLTDDLSDLSDINLYTNIYFTEDIRLEVDLLDASDDSFLKGTVRFQLPDTLGREWILGVSYGEDFYGDNQLGLSVKYVPDFNSSVKSYYRAFSTNIKSVFFN